MWNFLGGSPLHRIAAFFMLILPDSPFKSPQLPFNMDIADICAPSSEADQMTALLESVDLSSEDRNIFTLALRSDQTEEALSQQGNLYIFHPVLSRQERRHLAGVSPEPSLDELSDKENLLPTPRKRRRLLSEEYFDGNYAEDSGIAFPRDESQQLGFDYKPELANWDPQEAFLQNSLDVLDMSDKPYSYSNMSQEHHQPRSFSTDSDCEFVDLYLQDPIQVDCVPMLAKPSSLDNVMSPDPVDEDFEVLPFDTQISLVSQHNRATEVAGTESPYHHAIEPSRVKHAQDVAEFARLRARKIKERDIAQQTSDPIEPQKRPDTPPPAIVPPDLIDQSTLHLALADWSAPESAHRYIAGLKVLQNPGLTRSLNAQTLARLELVEREDLSGVDLAIDPDSAVILLSLFTLPTDYEQVAKLLQEQSRRHSRLLLVFETYSQRSINPFSPPIIRAVKKLRLILLMSEATAGCEFLMSFPLSVEESAVYIRAFGDCVQQEDPIDGLLWSDRDQWLDFDVAPVRDHQTFPIIGRGAYA
jgi:hypothetical protein